MRRADHLADAEVPVKKYLPPLLTIPMAIASMVFVSLTPPAAASRASGPSSSSAIVTQLVRVRSELGLDSDPAYVTDLLANPSAYGATQQDSSLYGLLLTPAEAVAVHRFNVANDLLRTTVAWAEANEASSFAGASITFRANDHAPVVNVRFSQAIGSAQWAASTVGAQAIASGAAATQIVRYSLSDLRAGASELSQALAAHHLSYSTVTADQQQNEVVVDAPASTADADVLAAASDPAMVAVTHSGRSVEATWAKDGALGFGLVDGAEEIQTTSYACSSGFAVVGPFGPFVMTAGHCTGTGLGTTWFQGGATLGPASSAVGGNGVDGGLISTAGHRPIEGAVFIASSDPLHPVEAGPVNPIGQFACQLGWATGGMDGANWWAGCGTLTGYVCVQSNSGYLNGCNYINTTGSVNHGDSGAAAVVFPSGNPNAGAVALADGCYIDSAGNCTGSSGILTDVYSDMQALNATLVAPGQVIDP